MTDLDAVNQMLSGIGEAPVTTIQAGNPEIDLAVLTLNQVSREVQAERWNFNREDGYSLAPNVDGFILIPSNVITVNLTHDRRSSNSLQYDVVVRDGKLYDKRAHSFLWAGPVNVNVTWNFAFEDLPFPFQLYVAQRASRVFASRSQGSEAMVKFNSIDETRLRGNCIAYDCDVEELNMLQDHDQNNSYLPYIPFDGVYRP